MNKKRQISVVAIVVVENGRGMKVKAVSGIMLTLLLIGMLILTFTIQPIKASGTIYIRADGSVEPSTANITSTDNVTYYFTNNNYDSIGVERDNIVIDGAGYTLARPSGAGIYARERRNVTIKNTEIKVWQYGIKFYNCSNILISGNNVTVNWYGIHLQNCSNSALVGNTVVSNFYCIYLEYSSNNTVTGNNAVNGVCGIKLYGSSDNILIGNNVTNNEYGFSLTDSSSNSIYGNTMTNNVDGIWFLDSPDNSLTGNNIAANSDKGIYLGGFSPNNDIYGNNVTSNDRGIAFWGSPASNNRICHNNFVNNTNQVAIYESPVNILDDGYPSGGNYWSDYNGTDLYSGLTPQNGTGSDGIGDTPYVIDGDNKDRYPFMGQNGWQTHPFTLESNVTITDRRLTTSTLDFSVSSPTGLLGYINVTMPMGLNTTNIRVFVDGTELIPPPFPIITNNSTHYFIYFEFILSTHEIVIQYATVDVAVTNVVSSKTAVGQGYSVSINVTVENQGDYTENFNVTAHANTTTIDTLTNITLTSGNSTTITFTWNTVGVPCGNYTINATATPLPYDIDTTDNTRTCWVKVTVVGDVTGNYGVSVADMVEVDIALGTQPGEPNYNPNADVNCNGMISVADMVLIDIHLGEVC